jgi:predicted AAA+ superfamily ATPase
MTLIPSGYQPRLIDEQFTRYLKVFGAIEIRGPKWCGKTWTALSKCEDKVFIADPSNDYANKALAQLDPRAVLQGKHPFLVDEWQEVPGLWDAVREAVDKNLGAGAYVLTGSAQPRATKKKPVHSGTGRIASIDMHPMTLTESDDSTKEVSLTSLFAEPERPIKGRAYYGIDDIIGLSVRGGWPRAANMLPEDGALMAKEYIHSIITGDDIEIDGVTFSSDKLGIFLRSFARNTATLVSNETVRRDTATNDNSALSRTTFTEYVDYLKRIYMMWEQPAFKPSLRSATRLRTSPKRHLADPSLVVACMNAGSRKLKQQLKTFGFVFETMVARDLLVYSRCLGGTLMHYRDNSNLEVDAIVETEDGYAAIEVKLGAAQEDEAVASLTAFEKKMIEGKEDAPLFKAVITGTGEFAHTRPDGIHVIPLGCLTL